MNIGILKRIIKDIPDSCDVMLVFSNSDNTCIVEDWIDFAPANVDATCPEEFKGVYLYGDSMEDVL